MGLVRVNDIMMMSLTHEDDVFRPEARVAVKHGMTEHKMRNRKPGIANPEQKTRNRKPGMVKHGTENPEQKTRNGKKQNKNPE